MGNEKVDLISAAKPEKKTLLERYNVPINNLSYEYISECTNAKTLEHIVLVLRSGEEGVYPDLTKHAEERLARIKPTSAILRKAEPVLRRNMLSPDKQREIDDEIGNWTCQMQSREKDIGEEKATLIDGFSSQPEIRKAKSNMKARINEKKHVKPKRISSCDYAAWDKYDADTEINRIDLQDEQRQAEMKRIQERRKELDKTSKATHKTAVDKHIKLQLYEDALNDCNMALADYEAVLTLEPTNKTAISSVNKLRKPCESTKKTRMKIEEENTSDGEDKVGPIKSKETVETKSTARPKQRVNSNICYCDRAPGSSRNVATKPHIKASYCVESSEGSKAANAAANKSNAMTTRAAASGDKLSPVAKDPGRGDKTSKARDAGHKSNDVFTIRCESLPRPRAVRDSLQKSIFSCVSSSRKGKSSVIIEELPNDGTTCDRPREVSDTDKAKMETKEETREEKGPLTRGLCADKNKESILYVKESKAKNNLTCDKIANEVSRKESDKFEMDVKKLEDVETPYEFLRLWQSLKNDTNLKPHAQLLRSIAQKDMNKCNKLDGTMLSLILCCLEKQFCTPNDTDLLVDLLYSLSQLSRFSIVSMFMDSKDKRALGNILSFLEKEDSPKMSQLRQIYIT
ncbi:PREDICTED: auxilin-related protein 1 [Dinoponera quadriceps]|uniref:Auxilin-related protein 1 n=1 Tax=Dinoponera quadriceps TaxID=609295 RepID=A0A6P3Y5J5_DINQU|nr:PREDICTED: auxilin-related protein 1 [Dinoponera quadriceps]